MFNNHTQIFRSPPGFALSSDDVIKASQDYLVLANAMKLESTIPHCIHILDCISYVSYTDYILKFCLLVFPDNASLDLLILSGLRTFPDIKHVRYFSVMVFHVLHIYISTIVISFSMFQLNC